MTNTTTIDREPRIVHRTGDPHVAEVFVAQFRDGPSSCVEFVDGLDPRFVRADKWILNVSTQFGCPVRCRFCDAGTHYAGNLTAAEMLAQVAYLARRHPDLVPRCRKLKVHFARMGEPALNPSVLDAARGLRTLLPNDNVWLCLATVAPAGADAWFEDLLALKNELFPGRCQLQCSVNSTSPAARRALMPIRLLSLDWLAAYTARFHRPADRKPSLNFALATDVPFEPQALIDRFDPAHAAIKLTPLNPTTAGKRHALGSVLRTERSSELSDKIHQLRAHGFEVVVSVGDPREDALGSNCGQAVDEWRRALSAR
jgi:23S rRNA (adenine2503-C2)-methyltransferase